MSASLAAANEISMAAAVEPVLLELDGTFVGFRFHSIPFFSVLFLTKCLREFSAH